MCDDWKDWDWKAACTALIRAVDPHSADVPVYLLDRDEAAGIADSRDRDAVGFTCIVFSDRFRGFLESRGEWRGRGFVAVLDVGRLETPMQVEGLALHEYLHDVLDRPIIDKIRAGDADPATIGALLRLADPDFPMRPPGLDLYPDDWRLWHHHPGDFIRPCIHAADRAGRRLGWLGDAADVWECDTSSDGRCLAGIHYYAEQLGNEPRRLADVPLAELPAIRPPAAFQRYAAEDLRFAETRFQYRYRRPAGNDEPCDETAAAIDIRPAAEPVLQEVSP